MTSRADQFWHAHALAKCTRKKQYDHAGQARKAAHKYGQRAYFCKHCKKYHTTSRSPDDGKSDPSPQ